MDRPSHDKSFRAFIAFDLAPEIQQTLTVLPFRTELSEFPWIPPENIHGSLKFLGTLIHTQQRLLEHELFTFCSSLSSFSLTFQGLGAFPNLNNPRILWVGVRETPPILLHLVREIEGFCRTHQIGEPENRPYQCHLTLARIKQKPDRRFFNIFDRYQSILIGAQEVNNIFLFKSDLQKGGANYTKVTSFPLGNAYGKPVVSNHVESHP